MPPEFCLGFDQLPVAADAHQENPWIPKEEAKKALSVQENDERIVVSGRNGKGRFVYTFDKKLGAFRYLEVNGKQILDRPMEFNINRAPIDNDRGVGGMGLKRYDTMRYELSQTRVYHCDVSLEGENVLIREKLSMAAISRGNFLTADAHWRVSEDGMIRLAAKVHRNPMLLDLMRFGIRVFLKKNSGKVRYYGFGPYESYVDKHHLSYMSLFDTDVDALFEDYVRPQENGSHWNTKYLQVGETGETGLEAIAEQDAFSFNVSH